MFKAAECRIKAKEKVALSKRDPAQHLKHEHAAEARLILAGKLDEPKLKNASHRSA